jgi:hypothetical protein
LPRCCRKHRDKPFNNFFDGSSENKKVFSASSDPRERAVIFSKRPLEKSPLVSGLPEVYLLAYLQDDSGWWYSDLSLYYTRFSGFLLPVDQIQIRPP